MFCCENLKKQAIWHNVADKINQNNCFFITYFLKYNVGWTKGVKNI
jgi:hypothetical protein